MSWIAGQINRLRVSRGFTVHSPFAFYFITRVLRESAPFYCFSSEVRRRRERRLFRLVNYFQPATVCILGTCDSERALQIMRMACSRFTLVDDPAGADFVLATRGTPELPLHCRALYAPKSDPQTRRNLIGRTQRGMTFADGASLVAVTRPGLPRQHFNLHFR